MATDLKFLSGRPVTIALAIVAAVGWLIAIWALAANSSQARGYEAQIAALRKERVVVVQELDALRTSAGTAAELGQKVEAGQAELGRLEVARRTADVEVAEVLKRLEAARVRLTEIARETDERTARLGTLRQEVEQAAPRRQALEAEIARLDQDVAARSRSLEDIETRLETVRREEARLREEVGRLGRALAGERAAATASVGTGGALVPARTTAPGAVGDATGTRPGLAYRCQQTPEGWRCVGSE